MNDAIEREARLTAYALGELNDTERAAFETELAGDSALQAEVEAIRNTVGQLEAALGSESAPGLTDSQREAIIDPPPAPRRFTPYIWTSVGVAAAACVGIAAFIQLQGGGEAREQDLAAVDRPKEKPVNVDSMVAGPADEPDVAPTELALAPAMDQAAGSGGHPEVVSEGAVRARRDAMIGVNAPMPRRGRSVPPPPTRGRPAPAAPAVGYIESMPLGAEVQTSAKRAFIAPGGNGAGAIDAGESYPDIAENPFIKPLGTDALSTFAVDVDTASYANVRRMINSGTMPPADAVRVEEMINYFTYDYEPATGDEPFSVNIDMASCPWAPEHRLMRVGLQAPALANDMRPATNLVYLLDVSGSMNSPQKLPLVKRALSMMVDHLLADDKVAIVVYAGASGLVLDSTWCDQKDLIIDALARLNAGGSTNGGAGIELAYDVAQRNFIEGGVNRVILCTDGDFNVGVTSEQSLEELIVDKRKSGIELSVLGFGSGNWQDDRMQVLAEKGNGNAAYIDSLNEAKKVLVDEMGGTLVTVAKDVKIQVEFNPAKVASYRLIGYASRLMAAEDFRNDAKDAGEIGAGHSVTALYEIVPGNAGDADDEADVELSFQRPQPSEVVPSDLLARVFLRYKQPGATAEDAATERAHDVVTSNESYEQASTDFQFASAVAAFGMLLRDSEHKGSASWDLVADLAGPAVADGEGRTGESKTEFVKLVERIREMQDGAED